MRILIDVRFLSTGKFSGIGEYAHNLISEMIVNNPEHHFILFYSGYRRPSPPINWTGRKNVSFIGWNIPNKLLNASLRFLNYPNLKKIAHPNIIFSPHFLNFPLSDTPRVLTIHDLSFIHHPQFFSKSQRFWHWFQDIQKQISSAHHIITDAHFTKDDLINTFNINPGKISVVPPGLKNDFKVLSSESEQDSLNRFKNKYNLNGPALLYLGALEPRKNITAVIRAFNLLKQDPQHQDLSLILAGSQSWLPQSFQVEIKKSPFNHDIKIIKNLVSADRVLLYNSCRAFVYPSFFEGFGFPPLEAQACGLPVVASDRTSLPEILNSSALLIDPWKVSQLADALSSVLSEGELRTKLINQGLENSKRFTWPATAQAIIKILEQ